MSVSKTDDETGEALMNAVAWMPFNSVSLQDDGGTLRPAWPAQGARSAGLDKGDQVTPHVHTQTGAVVFCPPDVELEDVTA